MSFLYLAGYCLRPGLGDSFDETAYRSVMEYFSGGCPFSSEVGKLGRMVDCLCRVSEGLNKAQQSAIYSSLSPWLLRVRDNKTTKKEN